MNRTDEVKEKEARELFLSHFPSDISERVRDYVRDVVLIKSRYIFATREKGLQYGYCTHCKEKYRTNGLKQNQKVSCSKCGSVCIVKMNGISRTHLVDEGHIVFYEKSVANPKAMIARSMYVRRDYRGDYHEVETVYSPRSMVLFEMGNCKMYRPSWRSNEWSEVNIISDFSSSYSNGYRSICPIEWIREAAEGTPYQYSTWESYHEGDSVKFFELFSRYPCIEYLTKLNMRYFVSAKLVRGITFGAIDWRGKRLDKVLKLDKQRAKQFITWLGDKPHHASPLTLRLFQLSAKENSNYTLEELDGIARSFDDHWSLFQKMLKYATIRRADGYVRRQRRMERGAGRPNTLRDILLTWRDYVADAERLGLDLSVESVVFPAKLYQAHQNTIKQVKLKEDEELNRLIRERQKVRDKYTFEDDGFLIRAAADTKELIEEGKNLHHCVGTYANKYASGKFDILVIRKVQEPSKPFFTMEIINGQIIQCRGFKNCGMTKRVEAFVRSFKEQRLSRKKTNRIVISGNSAQRQEAVV